MLQVTFEKKLSGVDFQPRLGKPWKYYVIYKIQNTVKTWVIIINLGSSLGADLKCSHNLHEGP